jgi:hypothetical protein
VDFKAWNLNLVLYLVKIESTVHSLTRFFWVAMGNKSITVFLALLIESMNLSTLEAQNPIKTLFNHAKNVNSYPHSATPYFSFRKT